MLVCLRMSSLPPFLPSQPITGFLLASRAAGQRDVQHLHQQLWLRHRDNYGEFWAACPFLGPPDGLADCGVGSWGRSGKEGRGEAACWAGTGNSVAHLGELFARTLLGFPARLGTGSCPEFGHRKT